MLQMKKTMALVLTLAVVAGCATNAPQVNSVSTTSAKVEAVKVTPVIDLGNKDGASFSLNLKFAKSSPFGIKTFFPNGFSSSAINPNSYIAIRLHRQGNAGTAPTALSTRFEGAAVSTVDGGDGTGATANLRSFTAASNIPLTFKGLNNNSAYSLSARVFSPAITDGAGAPIPIPLADISLDIAADPGIGLGAGQSVITRNAGSSAAYPNFANLNLKVNDIITIGASALSTATRYKVTDVGGLPNSFSIANAGGGAVTNQQFSLWRDIVSIDGTASGLGGGNQGAVDGGTGENWINVNSAGKITIMSGSTATALTTLGMNVQLMKELLPSEVKGNIILTAGAPTTGTELMTSP